jgi:hypothetical protein
MKLAGEKGFEPLIASFGDCRSDRSTTPLYSFLRSPVATHLVVHFVYLMRRSKEWSVGRDWNPLAQESQSCRAPYIAFLGCKLYSRVRYVYPVFVLLTPAFPISFILTNG